MKVTEAQIEERERLRQAEMKVNIALNNKKDKYIDLCIHKRELEKVKRRRIEREREKEARDNEMVTDNVM